MFFINFPSFSFIPSYRILQCLCLFLGVLCVACSTSQYLPKGSSYYDGSEIIINNSSDSVLVSESIKSGLNKLLIPKQKGNFCSIRLGVWFYYNHDRKGLLPFLASKLSKKPEYFEKSKVTSVQNNLRQYLKNVGYFDVKLNTETIQSEDKGLKEKYYINTGKPYTYNTISYALDTIKVETEVQEIKKIANLKRFKIFNLKELEDIRKRVESYMKNKGYYHFNQNDLIFKADSSFRLKSMNINLGFKKNIPKSHFEKYKIGSVSIYPDFSSNESEKDTYDTTTFQNLNFIHKDNFIKRKVLSQSLYARPDSLYNYAKFEKSINAFTNLGVYKYVNVKQNPLDSLNRVDFDFFLAPKSFKSIQLAFDATTNSDGYTGPGVNFSYNNFNFLRGAERFVSYLKAGILKQFGGAADFNYIYWLGMGLSLKIPRLVSFIKWSPGIDYSTPKTIFDVSWLRYNFVPVIILDYISFSYGFTWNKELKRIHKLNPVDWSYQKTPQNNDELDSLKGKYPLLSQTFRNQLIIGSSYNYVYYSSLSDKAEQRIRYNFGLNLSGNLLYFADRLFNPQQKEHFKILGLDYSQYVKITNDFRYFKKVGKGSDVLGFRTILGTGFPWGNAQSLPFVQQYFIGGPNDIRAFGPRSLGPGTYDPRQDSTTSFFGQGGDLKIEFNLEYRFPIAGFLKGAAFTDIGNIWLSRLDTARVGAEFNFNTFYRQLAVGVGLGLRLDFSIVLLRLDWAIPLRKPYIKENDGWVIDKINFGSAAWRRENLVFNIAIGYPF